VKVAKNESKLEKFKEEKQASSKEEMQASSKEESKDDLFFDISEQDEEKIPMSSQTSQLIRNIT